MRPSVSFRPGPLRGRATAVCLVVLACLAGCAPAAVQVSTAPSGTRTVTVDADGDRAAIVHHAASAAVGAPLVVVLHGARGTAAGMQARLGWPGAGPDAGRTDGPSDATGFLWAHLHG